MTMDTAGKAVLFSGATVLISLSAVMLVPSPAFRSMALGIMLSVVFVLAATLTLLPAVLAKLGPRVDRLALPLGALRRAPLGALRRAGASCSGGGPWLFGSLALAVLLALALPIVGLRTGMPSIKVVPTGDSSRVGYTQVQQAFGPGRAGSAADRRPGRRPSPRPRVIARHDPGIARVLAARSRRRTGSRSSRRSRAPTRRARASARRSTGCARPCPPGALVGGAAAENHDLEQALVGADAARDRRRARARLPAAARRAAGAADRRRRRADEPARHRRRVRRRAAGLPGRPRRGPARLRVAGLPRRLGAGLLLRDDLRDLDGLHGVPARRRRRSTATAPATRTRRWSAASPTPAA